MKIRYWVISDLLCWGTYTESLVKAKKIKEQLIKDGGMDARIEIEYPDKI